jgi:CRISPR-associated protein Cas2
MIVLTLTDAPAKVKGDISKWLFEVSTGVYAGNLSGRVRDELWERICKMMAHGRAVMLYSTNSEQGFAFRVYGTTWYPEDFDGLQIMKRPLSQKRHTSPTIEGNELTDRSNARQFYMSQQPERLKESYVVLDLETTGLDPRTDSIIEIGILEVENGKVISEYSELVQGTDTIPKDIQKLTGITTIERNQNGKDLSLVLKAAAEIIDGKPIVGHNIAFDIQFLQSAGLKAGIKIPIKKIIDTMPLARKDLKGIKNYKLRNIAESLNISIENEKHRALSDCYLTYRVYEKLKEIDQK